MQKIKKIEIELDTYIKLQQLNQTDEHETKTKSELVDFLIDYYELNKKN